MAADNPRCLLNRQPMAHAAILQSTPFCQTMGRPSLASAQRVAGRRRWCDEDEHDDSHENDDDDNDNDDDEDGR